MSAPGGVCSCARPPGLLALCFCLPCLTCVRFRRGLQLRSAARAAAEKAVKDEQQTRLDSLRRQMADYRKKAAEARQVRTALNSS